MARVNLDHIKITPELLQNNPHLREVLKSKDIPVGKLEVDVSEIPASKEDIRLEKDLQTACENWLCQNGYKRLSKESIKSGKPERGYFLHLHKTRKNPMILDLLILHSSGLYLMIELKTRPVFQGGQKELIEQGYGCLENDFAKFVFRMKAWHEYIDIGDALDE